LRGARHAFFCDDFDDSGAISAAWTNVNLVGDASWPSCKTCRLAPNIARSTVARRRPAAKLPSDVKFRRERTDAHVQCRGSRGRLARGTVRELQRLLGFDARRVARLGYNNKSPLLVVDDADGGRRRSR
jgi:hypothetical protein